MSSEANNDTADAPVSTVATSEPPTSAQAAEDAPTAIPSVIVDPLLNQASSAPLPSVIIDPTISAQSEIEAQPAEPEAQTSETAGDGDSEDDDAAWSAGTFSDHDADRFADSMRPSWDMHVAESEGGQWSAANVAPAAHNIGPAPTGRAVAPSNDSDGLPPVVLSSGIDKRMAFAGIGGLVLIIIAIWSMVDTKPDVPPPSWKGTTQTAPATAKPPAPAIATPAPVIPAPAPAAAAPTADLPPATPQVAAPSIPTQAPTPSAPAVTPTQPAEAKTVHVRISTTPSGAELKLDGERVPNPFDAWVNRGGSHNVVADADGYTQREWSIAFDQDQTLSLVLKREEAKRPARRVRRPAPRPTTSKTRPRGAGFVTDNPY